jgi:hypothetical protein
MANRKFLELCERKVGDILNSYSNNRSEEELITLMAYRELYGIDDMMRKDKKAVQKACVNVSVLVYFMCIKDCLDNVRLDKWHRHSKTLYRECQIGGHLLSLQL